MGIFSFILENVGEFALGRILDRIFDDKANNMEDAFNEAYNTWYVSHNNSVIQRKDYDRLKQRFIDYLCNKEGYKEDEDEISLYEEWLKVIERGINAHDKLQSYIIQKIINELGLLAYQVQINEEILIKLTELVESAISIEYISKKQASLEKEIGEIKSLIANKGLDSALQPQQFPKVEGYIEHYVISEKDKNNFVRYILKQKPQTLYDKVCAAKDGENKFLLVDKGQSGKTTELQELGYRLSQSDKYFPLLIKSYDKPNLSKDDLPVGDIYEGKNIVLLIDAADEFSQKERGCFFNFIKDYANEHLHTIIVVSCRNNYEETENLKCFQSLVFEDLSTDQWKNMIRGLAKDKADTLINLIIENGLQEYMATPFEVSVITNHYLSEGELLTTRAGIYRQFIYSKLEQDDKKLRIDGKQLKYDALPYLERIATVMQSYGNDFTLTYRELLNCVDNKENTLKLIQRSNLIIPIGQDKYKFSENAYREYLAAEYVSKQDFNSILSFIKYDSADSIRQHWANVTIILLSILNNENVETFKQLLDWLIRFEPEFVLFMERNTVEKNTREAVFRNLLDHYRKQHRIIAPANHQTSRKIIEFAQSTETMEFLLTEVLKNKDNDNVYLENLYSFIEYADFTDLTLCGKQKLVDNFKNVVFHLISKHLEDNKKKTFTLYFPLNNPYYHEDNTYTKKLIDTVGDTHNRYAVDAVLTMICFTDSSDDYTDYIINHEADLHDYRDERGITVSVSRFVVDRALEGVKEKDNIIKVLNHICKRDFLLRNSYRDDDTLNIVKNLLKNAKNSREFMNDRVACQSLLEIYANFMRSFVFNKQKDFNLAFEEFFKDCAFSDLFFTEAADKFKQILKDSNIDEYLKTLSIIGLLLTKDRFDKFVESLDPTNPNDYEVAARIYNLHDSNLDDYIGKKMDEKFGRHPVVVNWDSKKKESIDQLLNYDKFREAVIKAINKNPQKLKDLNSHSNILDDETDLYVSSFFYEISNEPFDLSKIKAAIDDKECYYRFLLFIYHRDRGDKELEKSLTDSIRKEIVNAAEQEIIHDSLTNASLYMFVNGKLNLHYEDVEKLLRLSNYTWGEYSLFNSIVDVAKKEGKQSDLLYYLCKHLKEYEGNADLYAIWACYIIRNDKKVLYPVIFDWMINDEKQWRHIQILEAYWSMKAGKKFIRYNFSRLSEDDKVSLLNIIESSKDKYDADWITGQLKDYANYKDYNKKAVLQFLLYRGDLNVLRFVVDHFDPKYLESDYSYNYNQEAATDKILFLFHKVVEDSGSVVPSCYNSLKQSLINISFSNHNKREIIIKDLKELASQHNEWLYDEIERIQEALLSSDDENKSFAEVINAVPLIKITTKIAKPIASDDYKVGNIVKLRDDKFAEIKEKFLFPQNLFYIKEIRDSKDIVLFGLKEVVKAKDILPVTIDGRQDRNIYYDFILAKDLNKNDNKNDIKTLPDTYYMESLKEVTDAEGNSWYNRIKETKLDYVHQIQNKFRELSLLLKIHYLPENKPSERNTKVVQLKNVGEIITKSRYLNLITKDPTLKEKSKIYITKKIEENNLIATKHHKDKINYDYVLLCNDQYLSKIDFYSFYLNSIMGRVMLLGADFKVKLHGHTNIKTIKEVPVFFMDNYVSSCCVLQSILELLLSFIFKNDNQHNEIKSLYDYLQRVGNAMVAEMAIPKYFDEFGIKILDNWVIEEKKIMSHINEIANDTTGFYLITRLFVSLLSSNNELTKNMNKYRLYSEEFVELVTQKGLRQ